MLQEPRKRVARAKHWGQCSSVGYSLQRYAPTRLVPAAPIDRIDLASACFVSAGISRLCPSSLSAPRQAHRFRAMRMLFSLADCDRTLNRLSIGLPSRSSANDFFRRPENWPGLGTEPL